MQFLTRDMGNHKYRMRRITLCESSYGREISMIIGMKTERDVDLLAIDVPVIHKLKTCRFLVRHDHEYEL